MVLQLCCFIEYSIVGMHGYTGNPALPWKNMRQEWCMQIWHCIFWIVPEVMAPMTLQNVPNRARDTRCVSSTGLAKRVAKQSTPCPLPSSDKSCARKRGLSIVGTGIAVGLNVFHSREETGQVSSVYTWCATSFSLLFLHFQVHDGRGNGVWEVASWKAMRIAEITPIQRNAGRMEMLR